MSLMYPYSVNGMHSDQTKLELRVLCLCAGN